MTSPVATNFDFNQPFSLRNRYILSKHKHMTKALSFLIISTLITFTISCKKEDPSDNVDNEETEVIDTLFPGEYFPVYPGSYWNYNDGSTFTVKATYEISYVYDYDWPDPLYADAGGNYTKYYLPIINMYGVDRAVYNYSFLHYSGSEFYEPEKFFDTNSNAWTNYEHGYGDSYSVINRDTSLVINGSIMDSLICVRSFMDSAPLDIQAYFGHYRFYKKGVGMVRKDWRSLSDSTEHSFELVDYFVNH